MHKTCPVEIKATGDDDESLSDGQFKAVVSVFGNVDSYGDVVVKGAFAETLDDWAKSGDSIPVYWSHRMDDPDMNIGYVVSAKETDQGLEVVAQLDMDDDASPKARQAYKLLKGRRVTQFSFAYDVMEGAYVEREGDSFYELRRLKLHEVGPTPVGANPATELLAVKAAEHARHVAAELKAGRVLSTKNEKTLRDALTALENSTAQIKSVLSAVEAQDDDDAEKASSTREDARSDAPGKAEGSAGVKAEDPNRRTPVDTWAALIDTYSYS